MIKNTFSLLEPAIGEMTAGLLTILGVIIGSKLSAQSARRQDRNHALLEAYADVFTALYICSSNPLTDENMVALVSAIERTSLLCSPESERILKEVLPALPIDSRPTPVFAQLVQKLRESAKKDLGQKKRH